MYDCGTGGGASPPPPGGIFFFSFLVTLRNRGRGRRRFPTVTEHTEHNRTLAWVAPNTKWVASLAVSLALPSCQGLAAVPAAKILANGTARASTQTSGAARRVFAVVRLVSFHRQHQFCLMTMRRQLQPTRHQQQQQRLKGAGSEAYLVVLKRSQRQQHSRHNQHRHKQQVLLLLRACQHGIASGTSSHWPRKQLRSSSAGRWRRGTRILIDTRMSRAVMPV